MSRSYGRAGHASGWPVWDCASPAPVLVSHRLSVLCQEAGQVAVGLAGRSSSRGWPQPGRTCAELSTRWLSRQWPASCGTWEAQ